MSSVLTVENLTVEVASRHGTSHILSDVSFSVDAGEVFGLVGESGCGKSTLALAIMRYLPESMKVASGRIMFNGQNVLELSARETRQMRSRGVAMVYQDPMASLNPVMKIGPQLVEVLTNQGSHSATESRRQAVKMLREVRLPDPDQIMDRYPFQLSGGQQQRVVIAMALISNPSLIIMDEPTTGLDATIEAAILELINDLRKRMGMAVLFISHNLRAVRHVSQRLAVLYAGRIVESGEAEEVFSGAAHPYTQGLLRALPSRSRPHGGRLQSIPGTLSSSDRDTIGCAFFSRCNFGLRDVCTGTSIIPRKVGADEQHWVSCVRPGATQSDSVLSSGTTETSTAKLPADFELLTVQGLSKTYKIAGSFGRRASSVQALSDVSLDLSRKQTVAIIGESGSGKSTIARILSGLTVADSGSARLGTDDIAKTRVGNRSSTTRAALQMVFQNPDSTLNPSHSVGFSLTRPLRLLRGMSRRDAKREAHRLAAQVNIPAEYLSARPQQLSGGQKQRIAIARALAAHPSVVIADEPVSALDVSVQATIINLLEDLQQSEGISYILISHDVALVQHMSDWVVVIYKGIVVEQGPRDAVFQPPYHPYTAAMLTSAFGAPLNGEPVTLLEVNEGAVTSSASGCPLYGRCPRGISGICDVSSPPVRQLGDEHIIRCHLDLPAEASEYTRLTLHRKEA